MTREPREGGREGGGGDERVGKPGGRGRFYERGFFRPVVFSSFLPFFFFSKDERESSCRAVSAQADFVTHVLPSVT